MTDKVIFLPPGTSWTVPTDWNTGANKIEMIDGGGGAAGTAPRTGGAGGNYRRYDNVSLTPGATANYVIGAGGALSGNGTPTTGGTSSHDGCTSPAQTQTGGAGAGTGAANLSRGGAAASPSGNGAAAVSGGAQGAGGVYTWTSTHNASGATSVATASDGSGGGNGANGQIYGGGGANGAGIAGAQGLIVITYTPMTATPTNLTGAQTTNAVIQSNASAIIIAAIAAQATQATTQSSAVVVQPLANTLTGAQTLAAISHASALAIILALSGAQTLPNPAQSSAIHMGSLAGESAVTGAQTTLAAIQSSVNAYVGVALAGAQTTQAATQAFSGDVPPYIVSVTGDQLLSGPVPTSFITIPTGTRRIMIGKLPSGANGVRISQPGYDVFTHPVDDERLIFSSEWPEAIPIYLQGTSRAYCGRGSSTVATISFASLGYIPYFEFVMRSPNDALGASNWPDTDKYYPRAAVKLGTWAPYNGSDGAEFFRATITDGQLRFEGEIRNFTTSFGLNQSWWIYWTIFKKAVN